MGNLLPQNPLQDVERLTQSTPVDPGLYKNTPAGPEVDLFRAKAPAGSILKLPDIAAYVSLEAGESHEPVAGVAIKQVAKPANGKPTMEIVGLHAEPDKEVKAVREVVPTILHWLGAQDAVVDPDATNIPSDKLREAGLRPNDTGQFVIPAAA